MPEELTATFLCNCEMDVHFPEDHPNSEWHKYGDQVTGPIIYAKYVGEICTDCANTHYKDFVINN